MFKKIKLIIVLILLLVAQNTFAQLNSSERRMLKNANSYFEHEEFDKALPLFLEIDSVINDYSVKYRIGACYLNTTYEKLKAIPFLEEVTQLTNIEMPVIVHYDLGNLYHYTYRFNEAISQYQKFIELAIKTNFNDAKAVEHAKKMIAICNDAIDITTQPFKAEIDILDYPINTMESEYCPMITADDATLLYMKAIGLGNSTQTQIMISRKELGNIWGKPAVLSIESQKNFENKTITLAGLSPDGQTVYLNIGENLDQDIYEGILEGTSVNQIKKLNKNINTAFFEGRVSVSSDGTELFFVSDRPGGFGGTDIYHAKRNRRGDWDLPVNLGEIINTKFNENSPFMHPDNITLFFSSEGHKTIGGSDIFKSRFENGNWERPQNLGFPNSTKDDLFFVLNANGQIGYFSSAKNNVYDKHNIYKVNFKDPIPLTLVKGIIKMGNSPMPGYIDIKVYDQATGTRVKYVYNPDPKTGKYLMIFPPAKNYDIIISSKEYLPHLININIPYQTYFYELYQEITLEPIKFENNTIGERITVNNTFYDLYKTSEADSILMDDLPKQPKYYDHLLELVETIIQTTDTMRINYRGSEQVKETEKKNIESLINLIEEAIETTDPVTLSILDANTQQKDKTKETIFYVEGDKNKSLTMQIIGSDTLYTAPPIFSNTPISQFNSNQNKKTTKPPTDLLFKNSDKTHRNYLHHYVIYYELDKDKIPTNYLDGLNEIAGLLINNASLGAEIYGYTDSQGEKRYNLSLSRQRAQRVFKYLIDKHVVDYKLESKGFGEATEKSENEDSKFHRRVEINIFELK